MADNSSLPPLCANGCGFYGSMENMNFCSKCYKDFLKEISVSEFETKPKVSTASTPYANSVLGSSSVSTASKVKNRCESCKTKVGLMGFSCRCGKVFCGIHRYPKEHSCTFDFKTADRLILAKENPEVKPDKLESRI